MGRGRIEIKKIENMNSRQVTFSKRKGGLMKKAKELSILCDAQVALIIFNSSGKLFEFANPGMEEILGRYNQAPEVLAIEPAENGRQEELTALRAEIEKLRLGYSQLMGKELDGMSFKELQHLEQLLSQSITTVKDKKEKVLMEQLEESRMQEQKTMLENQALRHQIEELRRILSPIPLQRKLSVVSSDTDCNCSSAKARERNNSDTALRLGISSDFPQKSKASKLESVSSDFPQKSKASKLESVSSDFESTMASE